MSTEMSTEFQPRCQWSVDQVSIECHLRVSMEGIDDQHLAVDCMCG